VAKIKRALMSVYDKTGIVEFARSLSKMGVEILSTGGTYSVLSKEGIPVKEVSDYTGSPEILDGRLKTLHPKIHGGVLAIRENNKHSMELEANGIGYIDMMVVNLYPFEATIAKPGCKFEEAIENIDIGGPTMIRAAAKNHQDVAVITDPADYAAIVSEMDSGDGELSRERLFALAKKAFTTTASYDSAIINYLTAWNDAKQRTEIPTSIGMTYDLVSGLRYGENPHQNAAFYKRRGLVHPFSIADAKQLQGKELSYNNIMDADAVLGMLLEFRYAPFAAVVVKHANPCGAAISESSVSDALAKAIACDPTSSFGGIIGLTKSVDETAAKIIAESFFEVVVAPSFDESSKVILSKKKKLCLLALPSLAESSPEPKGWHLRDVRGGMLVQERDVSDEIVSAAKVVTKRPPTADEVAALEFAWRICKHVKSNAIVFAGKDRTIGIGAGQMSRVDSSKIAVMKAMSPLAGSVIASDAFFPFRDGVDTAAAAGARAIVQPGGSIRDEEVIAAADEHDMAMLFTGVRHFRH